MEDIPSYKEIRFILETCKELGIKHYWSRPRTPKDHAEIERFNRTLEEEFLFTMGNYIDDLEVFNPLLTVRQNSCRIRQVLWRNWLIEYNCSLLANHLFKGRDKVKGGFNRPH